MENKPILEVGKRDLEQTKKIVILQFLSSESRPQLGLSSSLTSNQSHIFHNQRITKEKSHITPRRSELHELHTHAFILFFNKHITVTIRGANETRQLASYSDSTEAVAT